MIKTAASLTNTEKARLEQCEAAIERGLNTFVEVGRALTEIRDSKLYRIGFKTFDAYCKERWEIDRTRAYQLIGQANIVSAIKEVAGDLSNAFDISKRDADVVRDNFPAVAADIKARVDGGEAPESAAKEAIKSAKDNAKAERAAQQAEWDRQQQEAQAALAANHGVKAQQEAKQAAIDAAKAKKSEPEPAGITDAERIAELEEQVRILERDYEEVITENKKFGEMRALYQKGGFDAVVASKDEIIRVAETRIYGESEEKVRWMNSAKYWKKQALALGWKPKNGVEADPMGDAA